MCKILYSPILHHVLYESLCMKFCERYFRICQLQSRNQIDVAVVIKQVQAEESHTLILSDVCDARLAVQDDNDGLIA